MRRGPRCSWCHADYFTTEGARAHDNHTPYARQCMRCGEREDPQSAPERDDAGPLDDFIASNRRVPVNRVSMAIETMVIAWYNDAVQRRRAELLAEFGPH